MRSLIQDTFSSIWIYTQRLLENFLFWGFHNTKFTQPHWWADCLTTICQNNGKWCIWVCLFLNCRLSKILKRNVSQIITNVFFPLIAWNNNGLNDACCQYSQKGFLRIPSTLVSSKAGHWCLCTCGTSARSCRHQQCPPLFFRSPVLWPTSNSQGLHLTAWRHFFSFFAS